MILLPIVARELGMAARQPSTYRVRFWAALSMIGLAFFILFFGPSGRPLSVLSQTFFGALTVITFVYALLAGVFFTADCLSVEKRDGTLGLLFLTDLSGADVVLGKLVATSLHAFYGLLAVLPVLALPILVGGVTGAEFWRVLLVLVDTLLFSLALGIFVSAVVREEGTAVGTTLAVVVGFAGGLPGIYKVLESHFSAHGFEWLLLYLSPAAGCWFAFEEPYRSGGAEYFWRSIAALSVLGVGFIALACLVLPRVWQEANGPTPHWRWCPLRQRWRWGRLAPQLLVRRGELEINPFLWLVTRDRLEGMRVVVFSLTAVGYGLWCWFETKRINSTGFMIFTYALFGWHLMLKIRVAAEACRHLHATRRSGALELLLVTPIEVGEVVRGQLMALRRRFLWPMIALGSVNLLFLSVALRDPQWTSDVHGLRILSRFLLGGIVMLAFDFYSLSWVGMWLGLSGRNFSRSVGGTIGRVMGLPWLVFVVFFLSTMNGGMKPERFEDFLISWFAFGVFVDAIVASKAKRRLRDGFRTVVAQASRTARTDFGWWPFSLDLDAFGSASPEPPGGKSDEPTASAHRSSA